MRERFDEWAPYLGALGIAVWTAVALLFLLGSVSAPILLGLAGLGVFFVALYIINRPSEVRTAVTGRTAVYGSNSLILAVAFVGIVAVATFLVNRAYHGRVDVTAAKSRTLSELTINVLKNLAEPVNVIGFFSPTQPGNNSREFNDRLKDYQFYTPKLTYKEVDYDANPVLDQEYDVVQPGTVVFERGSGATARREKVFTSDENALTNAILKVTQTQAKTIYFTTGHGERALADFQPQGINTAAEVLRQLNYKVEELNFATVTNTVTISGTTPVSGSLPVDTSAVIVAGPTKPFSASDTGRLKEYLDHGGRVLLLLDVAVDPGLQDLLAAYGVTLHDDLVLDPGQSYQGNAAIPVIGQFPGHDVTKGLDRFGVFFPGARAVTAAKTPPAGRAPIELFKTTDRACGKTDLAALRTSQQIAPCDAAKDEKGPLSLGVVVEVGTEGSANGKNRLVVIGNSAFISNNAMQDQNAVGDQLLLQNAANWLAGQEQLIAIPPRPTENRSLGILTGSDESFIFWSSAILIPLATLLLGGIVWWRRR